MDTQKLGLGRIIDTEQQRDAIHVAIVPIVVSQRLLPGTHVGLNAKGEAAAGCNLVGVIDPFLREYVHPGQKCWLFIYPGTITSLRHEWTHPEFEDITAPTVDPLEDSKQWVRRYAEVHRPYDRELEFGKKDSYTEFMLRVEEGEIFYWGEDCHNLGDVEDSHELFLHLSRILGRPVNGESFTYSCSC